MVKPLWNHQVNAIRQASTTTHHALFMDMGTGKTRTAIEILRHKYQLNERLLKTLILAPIIVCKNWRDEFLKYSKIPNDMIVVLTKSGKKREEEFVRAVGKDLDRGRIVITNYESLDMEKLYALLLKWAPEVLICDESQRLKNPQGKRSRAVIPIADAANYRYILSGTPILNNPMDIFMQFRALDGGATFGKNFYAFRGMYFEDKNAAMAGRHNYFPKWVPREDSYAKFQELIAKKSTRVLKSECLDLPPLVRQRVEVELSAEQRKMYKQMYNEYIAFCDGISSEGLPATVTAQLAITKSLRLQQIVSGFVPVEQTGGVYSIQDVPRLKVLKELLEDIVISGGHKVIVWACFKENYKQIAALCSTLGIKYGQIHGDMTRTEVEDDIEFFRSHPGGCVMIANQRAGGVGLNLIEASYMIYYSKTFSLEDDLQSEARNYRGGSEVHDKVTRVDLIAPGTIDELINEAVENKLQVSQLILDWKERMKI